MYICIYNILIYIYIPAIKLNVIQRIVKAQNEYIKDLERRLATHTAYEGNEERGHHVSFEDEKMAHERLVTDLQAEIEEWKVCMLLLT